MILVDRGGVKMEVIKDTEYTYHERIKIVKFDDKVEFLLSEPLIKNDGFELQEVRELKDGTVVAVFQKESSTTIKHK